MSDINIFAVLSAAIISFAVGAVWHGPLFGKKWMELSELTPEKMKAMKLTPNQAMSMGFLNIVIFCFVTAYFVSLTGTTGISEGVKLAFFIWLGFIGTTLAGGFLWENKSWQLLAFNLGYYLVNSIIITLIVTLWQ